MLLDKNQLTVVRTHRRWRVRFSNSISRPKSTSFAVKRRGARVGTREAHEIWRLPRRPDGTPREDAHSRTQDRRVNLGPPFCGAISASMHPDARSICVPAVLSHSIREALMTSKHWKRVPSPVNSGLPRITGIGVSRRCNPARLVAQDDAQEGVVDLQTTVVLDKPELPKFVHEEIDARPRRAEHFGERAL